MAPFSDTPPYDPVAAALKNAEPPVKPAWHDTFTDFHDTVNTGDEAKKTLKPPTPAGAEIPDVSPEWAGAEIQNYRKRVYGWWKKAHTAKKEVTRADNADKARKAFAWFEDHGATVIVTGPGQVTIQFPRG